jgi:hypothetical protein
MAITLYDYLASQNPKEAYQVMIDSGLDVPNPRSARQLANMLKRFVRKGGDEAIEALAKIHPDKDLIEAISVKNVAEHNKNFGENNVDKITLNADGGGCGCGCGGGCKCGSNCKCNENTNDSNLNFCPSCSLAFDGRVAKRRGSNGFMYFSADGDTTTNTGGGLLQSRAHEILIGVGVIGIAVALIIKATK